MTYGRARYGGAAYGGSALAPAQRRGAGLGLPGFDPVYFWYDASASAAYGGAAYGGRRASTLPAAGILAFPDPAAGAVSLTVWWAFADVVSVNRVEPDGTRTPLRDSPVVLDRTLSRRNSESNPKAKSATTGLAAGSNTALSRITGLTLPAPLTGRVTTAFRATASAAGSVALTNTVDAVGTTPSVRAFLVRTSALASGIAYSVTWYDASGALVGTVAYPASAAVVSGAAAGWTWATVTILPPGNAATGAGAYTASGLPAGGTLDITARISERGMTVGPYFDGDDPYAAWIGAAGLSLSDLAAPAYLVDAEAPLDVPVRYELSAAAASGYVAVTEALALGADAVFRGAGRWGSRRRALLTHPGQARTVRVWIDDAPDLEQDIQEGRFRVKGRSNLVVVQAAQRDGFEASLTMTCEDGEEYRRLMSMFAVPSPMLLRLAPNLLYPPVWWLSFGKLSIKPLERSGRIPVRKISVPVTQVDRPTVASGPIAV